MSEWVLGQTVMPDATFRVNGVLTDPTTVTATVRAPSGSVTAPTALWRSVGVWGAVVTLNEAGVWWYRFVGTGAVEGVVEGSLSVTPSMVAASTPVYTYDLATDIGKVRLNVDDRDFSRIDPSLPGERRSAIWTDAELQAFLDASTDVHSATAAALRMLANSRALLVQSRRIGETQVDYGSVRSDLMKAADAYERLSDEASGGALAPADGIAEIGWDDFSTRRIIVNQALRRDG